jgi:hypothetical protein
MGSHVEREERYADMAMGMGQTRNKAHEGGASRWNRSNVAGLRE